MQLILNGKPLTVSVKQVILSIALVLGGFTGGAINPELNPLNIFESPCEVE